MLDTTYFLQAKKNVISRWQPKAERRDEPWTLWRCLPGPKDKEFGPEHKAAWRIKKVAYRILQRRLGQPIVPWEDHPDRTRHDIVALIDDHLNSVGARPGPPRPPRPVKKNGETRNFPVAKFVEHNNVRPTSACADARAVTKSPAWKPGRTLLALCQQESEGRESRV